MPFAMYAKQIESELDLRVENVATKSPQDRTDAIARAIQSDAPPKFILVMPHWAEPVDELCVWFDSIRDMLDRADLASTKLVMLDYYAPTSSPHFPVMAHVDIYIKRQTLANPSQYNTQYQSGFVYADFVADTWGFDLGDWHFGSLIPQGHAHKLVSGWNLGITPRYRRMLRLCALSPLPWSARPIDLHLRVGTINRTDKKQEWYQFSRGKALQSVERLKGSIRMSGSGRVGTKRYYAELFTSKIVFSPFGWGEVCFRDYEAIAAGALLIKPDMSHLQTEPDIYIPNQTYVPVAWDYSDAADVIERYLSDPSECKRIISNARHALLKYDRQDHFVDTLARCLQLETKARSNDR